jgi:Na+/melibiose symporter-like transporter
LGQTAILFIYFAACCSTPLTSLIIKKIGFKKTFLLCSLGYISFDLSALFMADKTNPENRLIVIFFVCMGAFACGFSASLLWVAQGGYISQTAN